MSTSIVRNALGVIYRPAGAMHELAARRPWLAAIGVYALATGIISIADSMHLQEAPAQVAGPGDAMIQIGQSLGMLAIWVLVSPLVLVLMSGLTFVLGGLLGGRGHFTGLLATQGFAILPGTIRAPLTLGLDQIGVPFMLVDGIGMLFLLWWIVLALIGIRAALDLSIVRATAIVLLVPVVLAFVLFPVLLAAIVTVAGESVPSAAIALAAVTSVAVLVVISLFPPQRLPVDR
jgi:hypothetical protein